MVKGALGGAEAASISEDTGEDAQPQHFWRYCAGFWSTFDVKKYFSCPANPYPLSLTDWVSDCHFRIWRRNRERFQIILDDS